MDSQVKAVINAWSDDSPVVDTVKFHYVMKDWIRKSWPELATALDELAGAETMLTIQTDLPALTDVEDRVKEFTSRGRLVNTLKTRIM